MSGPILEVRGVEQRFGPFQALGPVDLVLHRGERLGIIGPNGSGKTTLINCISGTLRPQQGRVVFDGVDVTDLPPHRRARMGLSRSFQIPKPFTGMTVLENLLVPIDQISPSADAEDRALAVLESVGLQRRAGHEAGGLSQLELRKLELARALVVEPKVLVADEAMAGLSEGEIDDVLAILTHLSATGIAVIMIEHIMHAVMRFSTRIVCFETGRTIADAAPDVIAADPLVQKVYFGEQTRH
ncbi:ABC transporter ATP-binding protein [Rhodoplanes roseus]|uniref:ABC transporter ATP-binding protein n=1 Tax=Rhodoplanes roseus TaxID=29409 RepID=A0A327KJE8_9BRAD|nr:ABC transporter ATP-binding protein [Rhodoplanes roseus]RAI37615.1 ABC transporter ATP-binding protein [Rhodoplanes roseus]